jgi:hypothetical protein
MFNDAVVEGWTSCKRILNVNVQHRFFQYWKKDALELELTGRFNLVDRVVYVLVEVRAATSCFPSPTIITQSITNNSLRYRYHSPLTIF